MSDDDDAAGADTMDDEMIACPQCNGSGHHQGDSFILAGECFLCRGETRVPASIAEAWHRVRGGGRS